MTTVPPVQAYAGSTPNDSQYYYSDNSQWSKDILVTRDPVFVNKAVVNGEYIGRQPHTYIYLAIAVSFLNPLLGPFAIMFAVMSRRSYDDGDVKTAMKWANYSFMMGMMTIGISVIFIYSVRIFSQWFGYKRRSHSLIHNTVPCKYVNISSFYNTLCKWTLIYRCYYLTLSISACSVTKWFT